MEGKNEYTELYAVPKNSFDAFIKYRIGNFPNVKNLKVQQLNFNEAKKLNTFQQHNIPTNDLNNGYKQLNLTSLPSYSPLFRGQNVSNPSFQGMGQKLGSAENIPSNPNERSKAENISTANNASTSMQSPDVTLQRTSNMQSPNESLGHPQLNFEDLKHLNTLREHAAINPNLIKQSESAINPIPGIPKPILNLGNQTNGSTNFNDKTNGSSNFNDPLIQNEPFFDTTNNDQNIFYTSKKRSHKKTPKTSTPDQALKKMEQTLQDVRGQKKDFISANISAVSNTSQPVASKKRNPRHPVANNTSPVATKTRSKILSANDKQNNQASFNRSAVKQQKHIRTQSENLQRSATRR